MRRVIGIVGVLAGFVLLGITVSRVVNNAFTTDLSTSVLYAAFSFFLLAVGFWLIFQ